jgi:hypothetical protein
MDSLTSQLDKETLDKFRRIIGLEKEKKDMEDDMFYKEKNLFKEYYELHKRIVFLEEDIALGPGSGGKRRTQRRKSSRRSKRRR